MIKYLILDCDNYYDRLGIISAEDFVSALSLAKEMYSGRKVTVTKWFKWQKDHFHTMMILTTIDKYIP